MGSLPPDRPNYLRKPHLIGNLSKLAKTAPAWNRLSRRLCCRGGCVVEEAVLSRRLCWAELLTVWNVIFKRSREVTLRASSGNWKGVIPRILCDFWVHLVSSAKRDPRYRDADDRRVLPNRETGGKGGWAGRLGSVPAVGKEASGSPLELCSFLLLSQG